MCSAPWWLHLAPLHFSAVNFGWSLSKACLVSRLKSADHPLRPVSFRVSGEKRLPTSGWKGLGPMGSQLLAPSLSFLLGSCSPCLGPVCCSVLFTYIHLLSIPGKRNSHLIFLAGHFWKYVLYPRPSRLPLECGLCFSPARVGGTPLSCCHEHNPSALVQAAPDVTLCHSP